MIPIIDTHQHLWNREQFRLSWIEPGSVLDRDYSVHDYQAETSGLNVAMTVYMEVDVDEEDQKKEAVWAVDMCRSTDHPMVAAVISGRPASPQFAEYLESVAMEPEVAGVRQVLHGSSTPAGFCLQPSFIDGIRRLGNLGLSFDLCMRPHELPDAAKLADACPDTRFILDHCGNPQVLNSEQTDWFRDIAELARRQNVVCKVSGIVASARPGEWTPQTLAPFVDRCAEVFGPDRILFGGDWPVCRLTATLREWIEALKEIVKNWNPEERRKLFFDNALRIYRLGES